jgi:hypothetical protein
MIIKYRSCDGVSIVEEAITKLEVFRNICPPHEPFIRCTLPDGDIFEIYDLADLDEVRDG